MKKLLFIILIIFINTGFALNQPVKTGAEQSSLYLPLLKEKKVGLFINHTSLVGKQPLVDFLRKKGIHVTKIFVPEHGFRGEVDAGDIIENSIDEKTGLPIVSLYGAKKKPTAKDLENVDVLIFDVQDVGVRFYTFISSLQRLMEAAVENKKSLIILDRPNPNGFYVDGPVLNPKYHKIFTGLQPIPVVHGMTVGEYAKMLVGEQWLSVTPKTRAKELDLTVIPNLYYTHKTLYEPPVSPSPNLPNIQSIYLYPSIGYIEGMMLSVGRGTDQPFRVFGHPKMKAKFTFVPVSKSGAKHPPYENQICHGWSLDGSKKQVLEKVNGKFQVKYLRQAYQTFHDKEHFFPRSKRESEMKTLGMQIQSGMSDEDIRKSWEPELGEFKKIRKKYLLYPDFD